MKKFIKVSIFLILSIVIIFMGLFVYLSFGAINVKLDKNKLVNLNTTITYFDRYNQEICELSDGVEVTEINKIPSHTINAFIAVEDKRFYSHNGVDYKRLFASLFNNIKSLSFKEGASTISQQLIKNTHLSSEKTLSRKFAEIKLAIELEKNFSKDEIMEKYLNTIYFGDNCYGITSASKYYFGKTPEELTLNQSAILASIIKAPSNYSPFKNKERCTERKNLVLKEMLKEKFITQSEYDISVNEPVITIDKINSKKLAKYDFIYFANKELNTNFDFNFNHSNLKVKTTLDNTIQEKIENVIKNIPAGLDTSLIVMNKYGEILSYYSTCGDINRQMGSIIKPLLVYAPAVETDFVTPYTIINDSKIDFNGYSPSNYNDVYYGDVSVKYSLAKSLNTCSAKLLNSIGISKALSYFNKLDIPIEKSDNSLALALGATKNGAKLSDIVSSYGVFLNGGAYYPARSIKSIQNDYFTNENRNIKKIKVFSDDTTFLVNDMTRFTVTYGTAKALSFSNLNLHAKTGTVGNDNGNTDAYSISYNTEYVVGCWVGRYDGKFMGNDITGGSLPSKIALEIWKDIYHDKNSPDDFAMPDSIKKVDIDLVSYEKDGRILLADDLSPKRYVKPIFIKNKLNNLEKSNRFSSPSIDNYKTTVNERGILIELCLAEYYHVELYKEYNGNKIKLYDTINGKNNFFDDKINFNIEQTYIAIPYFIDSYGRRIYGNEIILNKIKPSRSPDGWWLDDLD